MQLSIACYCKNLSTSSALFNERTLSSKVLRKMTRKILTDTDMLRYFLIIFRKTLLATARSQILSTGVSYYKSYQFVFDFLKA